MQQQKMHFCLCFHPLWLQIYLELVHCDAQFVFFVFVFSKLRFHYSTLEEQSVVRGGAPHQPKHFLWLFFAAATVSSGKIGSNI